MCVLSRMEIISVKFCGTSLSVKGLSELGCINKDHNMIDNFTSKNYYQNCLRSTCPSGTWCDLPVKMGFTRAHGPLASLKPAIPGLMIILFDRWTHHWDIITALSLDDFKRFPMMNIYANKQFPFEGFEILPYNGHHDVTVR